jgi:hypothetical protein
MMKGVTRALLLTAMLSSPALTSAQEQATRPTESQFNYTCVDGLPLSGSFELADE